MYLIEIISYCSWFIEENILECIAWEEVTIMVWGTSWAIPDTLPVAPFTNMV